MYHLGRIHKPWEKLIPLWNLKNKSYCSYKRILSNVNEVKFRTNTLQCLLLHNFKRYGFDQASCLKQLHTSTINYVRHVKLVEDLDVQKGITSEVATTSKGLNSDNSYQNEFKDNFNLDDKSISKSYIHEHPKNVLNNFYAIVSQELGIKFYASPTFTKNHNDWLCTYHLKWPESLKISKRAHNKRDASHKAAVAVLEWLQSCGKINTNGQPVIYDAAEIRNIYTKVNRKVLTLNQPTITKLNLIDEKYSKNFFDYLETNIQSDVEQEKSGDLTKLDSPWPLNYTRQRILSTKNYLVRENVELPIQEYKYVLNIILV